MHNVDRRCFCFIFLLLQYWSMSIASTLATQFKKICVSYFFVILENWHGAFIFLSEVNRNAHFHGIRANKYHKQPDCDWRMDWPLEINDKQNCIILTLIISFYITNSRRISYLRIFRIWDSFTVSFAVDPFVYQLYIVATGTIVSTLGTRYLVRLEN